MSTRPTPGMKHRLRRDGAAVGSSRSDILLKSSWTPSLTTFLMMVTQPEQASQRIGTCWRQLEGEGSRKKEMLAGACGSSVDCSSSSPDSVVFYEGFGRKCHPLEGTIFPENQSESTVAGIQRVSPNLWPYPPVAV